MKVIVGAGELASIVLNLSGKDSLIRRSLINYIMAFPVVLKVCYLSESELVHRCSGC